MGIEHMVFSLLLRANSLRRSLQSKEKKYVKVRVESNLISYTQGCQKYKQVCQWWWGRLSNRTGDYLNTEPEKQTFKSWSMLIAWE